MGKPEKEKIEIIDLEKEVLLRIGEGTDINSVPWHVLRDIGNGLEKLIHALAKNSEQNRINFEDDLYRLDFTGFYKGSAVPAFSLSQAPQLNIQDTKLAKKKLNEDFSYIMAKLSKGDFLNISRPFQDGQIKNEVIKRVAYFSNTIEGHALSIAQKDKKGKIRSVYRVRKLSDQVVKSLLVPVDDLETDSVEESINALAKIKITRTRSGKESRKTTSIFVGEETEPSMRFDSIPGKNGVYELNHPITFVVVEEGKGVILENQELDIYAPGRTTEDAKIEAFSQFDEGYRRLTKLSDKKLSNHLLTAKRLFKIAVRSYSKVK